MLIYKAENTKSQGLKFIDLLSEDGTELLEIARTLDPRRHEQNTPGSDPPGYSRRCATTARIARSVHNVAFCRTFLRAVLP